MAAYKGYLDNEETLAAFVDELERGTLAFRPLGMQRPHRHMTRTPTLATTLRPTLPWHRPVLAGSPPVVSRVRAGEGADGKLERRREEEPEHAAKISMREILL